jgi:hypothetical protein
VLARHHRCGDSWRTCYEEDLSKEMDEYCFTTRTVGTQKLTVHSQPVTLRLLEGANESGCRVRQVGCGFKGKSGDILLAMVAGENSWDQGMVNGFLKSIR